MGIVFTLDFKRQSFYTLRELRSTLHAMGLRLRIVSETPSLVSSAVSAIDPKNGAPSHMPDEVCACLESVEFCSLDRS